MTVDVPPPGEGEVLVRNIWMSVDPYMRGRMMDRESYIPPFRIGAAMEGGAVGQIVASNATSLKTGDYVVSMQGWREYAVGHAAHFQKIDPSLAPIQAYLGTLGMPRPDRLGRVVQDCRAEGRARASSCPPRPAPSARSSARSPRPMAATSSAAPARTRNAAGWKRSPASTRRSTTRPAAISTLRSRRPSPRVSTSISRMSAAPHLEAALNHMKQFGRAAFCGLIEQYNDTTPRPGPSNLIQVVGKSLKLQGFIVAQYFDQLPHFIAEAAGLIKAGKLKWQETVEHGLENAPKAFLKLFSGENNGKMLVKIGPDSAV
ncbi:MAG: NADP-dependent oxidoreductase [Aliidongia sp.]